MKKILLNILKVAAGLYIAMCILLYIFQEKLIFFPHKLKKDHTFQFVQEFEELNIKTQDGTSINGLLFRADSSKGLIFYLHGNAGSLDGWGKVAETYTGMQYDVFIFDYRGFGKSEGQINGQEQIFRDNQAVYDELKKRYSKDKIIVLGYSIGTGLAAKIAAENNPRMLILQAPYYSMTDIMEHRYPFVPTGLLRYTFATNMYLKACNMPMYIFHGNTDGVIYHGSSLKLKDELKERVTLITLNGQGHNGMTDNPDYRAELRRILK